MPQADEKTSRCLMVIDDDSTIRLMLQTALQWDYEMLCIPNGSDATELVESSQPNLILLDIDSPGSDNYSLCKEIRRMAARLKIPILFMTVRQSDARFFAELETGGNSCIKKPFDMPALKHELERILPPMAGPGGTRSDARR